MALWSGRFQEDVSEFTQEFGASLPVDKALYHQDIAGSRAHAHMLAAQGIISKDDAAAIDKGLASIEARIEAGDFPFDINNEDIHMSVESVLTEEIGDAVEMAKQCPDTTLVLDHMGFLDPFAWNDPARADYVKQWKDNITAFGALPNTAGKVSGMNSGDPAVIAEPINFYLNAFEGGKRCIYASNYPVVELDIPLDTWIKGLMEVVKDRPQEFKDALFMENVKRIYKL